MPLPTGVKRTVLDLLLQAERTAEEIADEIGVTGTAIRQHLGTLLDQPQAEQGSEVLPDRGPLRLEQTAEEIADEIGVTGTAIRQHLGTLLGLGLVERRKAATSGGRPAFLYRLSEAGRSSYPKRHDLLSSELVAALLERDGRDGTLAVVVEAARRLADANRRRFEGLTPQERWEAVLAWLESELAWEAEVEEGNGARRVILHQCPFRAVSAEHPAVCGAFLATLLERLTGAGPFVHHPLGDGLVCCALAVERTCRERL